MDMEMKHARFHIQIEEKADWGADGKDKVEFLISANAGEPLKPLAKIASGGEMSPCDACTENGACGCG